MKNFFIIGGSGPLGINLAEQIINQKNDYKLYSTYNSRNLNKNDALIPIKINFLNRNEIDDLIAFILKTKGEIIIFFLASISKPDIVEKDLTLSRFINVELLNIFLQKLSGKNIKFFFSSTDMVYGDSAENQIFDEKSKKNSMNSYAQQKSEAEDIALKYGANILRQTFMFGPSLSDYEGFYEFIYKSLKNGKQIDLFYDSYKNFIDFKTSSDLMLLLSSKALQAEIFNLCADQKLSKYDLGLMVAKKFSFNENLLNKISFKEQDGRIYKTPRPGTTLMSNNKLKTILNIKSIKIAI